jgi:uncharacterized membrane protein YgcG
MRKDAMEEKWVMAELIAENKTMMMDPTTMDAYTIERWNLARMEMLQRRRQVTSGGGSSSASGGGGSAPASGGGGGLLWLAVVAMEVMVVVLAMI